MLRRLSLTLILGVFVLSTACSSKKKAQEGSVEGDPSVSAKDIAFDPLGSDSGNIAGLSTINFEYDQSVLNSEARRLLAANADWIKANTRVTIQIEGHCDSRGSVEYNLALGERRAQAVKNYLTTLGVEAGRLTIISYGKEKPIASGETEEAYFKNRRANFVPLPN